MAQPSLIVVPSRFKAGTLYAYSPLQTAPVSFGVTRGTTATRINSAGAIESVASGVPRLDYGAGACPGLLVEPAATNLLLRSEEFDDASWAKTRTTITANTTIAPNGTLTADKLIETADSGTHIVDGGLLTTTSGLLYTLSVFAKAAERSRIVIFGLGMQNVARGFDLANGTTYAPSGLTSASNFSITALANGWYRCSVTFVDVGAGFGNKGQIRLDNGTTTIYLGDGTSGVFIWGAQLETGSVATSYIPTVAATATRNADVISLTGASGLIGQTEGTIYVEADVRAVGVQRSFFSLMLNSNSTDFINLQINASNQMLARARAQTGTLNDVTASSVVSGRVKLAAAYQSGNLTFAVNGVIIGANTNASVNWTNPLNFIGVGHGPLNATDQLPAGFINDRINAAAIYKERLSNAELAQLTTL